MADERLRVVLGWHMHQPDYRDAQTGQFMAPWVYLHALKDYADMAAHLENAPGACATFNFTPVLLDQIEDYAQRIDACLREGRPIGGLLLDTLAQPVLALDDERRRTVVRACLRANRRHMIERFTPYRQLAGIAEIALEHAGGFAYLDDAFVFDLLVWHNLAWLGESVRADRRAAALVEKARRFSRHDRSVLLELIRDVLADLPRRYRTLAEQSRVELSTSPYAHPILPLLLDFASAREANAAMPLPLAAGYPGGAERVRWQLAQAQALHAHRFGAPAEGCWPSEGALSAASLDALAEAGFAWTASSLTVLRHSLGQAELGSDRLHRPYRLHGAGPAIFFRDDVLSDLIGFTYKDWAATDAVGDLLRRLEAIAAEPAGPGRVVGIVLDGENAWEHYPENGRAFLVELYGRLAAHPQLELTTFARCMRDPAVPVPPLERLVAGSWVHGDLGTWIGHADKNRAWDLLVEAKGAFDRCDAEVRRLAERQLGVCEGSDWFWWPGEWNPGVEVAEFERLFRVHLAGLYRALRCEAPDHLGYPFTRGSMAVTDATPMRPHR
ncbi:MAG: glycoside hydrolase family 57 protein [Mizugakiibacter sp.]|uniref:glycoside hydrolase family 57 protein n=1 Tax=Mizugakiibacter sp. TaxID=1972610 RepID=UPI0031C4B180|nr:hypothetical protein [Xanthomonadaceae bacterium]